jgi:hypothetical protein
MKTSLAVCLVFVFIFGVSALPLMGQGSEGKADAPGYVGTTTCKMCHKGEAKGSQFEKWQASAHADAYNVLGTDKAKEAAAKAGVENPQESEKCMVCHSTAFGVDASLLGKKFSIAEGVQCEGCHGPGSAYKSKKVMQDREAAIKSGMIVPDEKTCTTCHNEKSPTFKGFDFATYWEKIAHPVPGE